MIYDGTLTIRCEINRTTACISFLTLFSLLDLSAPVEVKITPTKRAGVFWRHDKYIPSVSVLLYQYTRDEEFVVSGGRSL